MTVQEAKQLKLHQYVYTKIRGRWIQARIDNIKRFSDQPFRVEVHVMYGLNDSHFSVLDERLVHDWHLSPKQ